ncbi:hypothetical protein NMG60_11034272 [Bertholletia excelsa]
MAGRNRLPPNALEIREVPLVRAVLPGHPALIDDPRVLHRVPIPPPSGAAPRPHPAVFEERIVFQQREIQSLLVDNQQLAATHVALKQELVAAQQELRRLSATGTEIKAERDAQVREVHERSMKMEAEVRAIDALNSELVQVSADIQKMSAARQELTAKLKAIDNDLGRARGELQQLPAIKAEIEAMHQEIQRGRAAIEYEKKVHASNHEIGQAMEKNMISMAREIEKLRAELANAEKRARAAAAAAAAAASPSPGLAAGYGHPDMGFGGHSYSDPYAVHRVEGSADAGPQYNPATAAHGPYDAQQAYAHR